MKILCNIGAVLIVVIGAALIILVGISEATINTTYDVGQMVQLKMGGTGMVTRNGRSCGYLVRVGHEEILYKEFELEEL